VHDEAGTVDCHDAITPPVRRAMSYAGHESDRETLKYRCPAKGEGFASPAEERCNEGKKYGLTARVPREVDL